MRQASVLAVMFLSCGSDPADLSLSVEWKFLSGDCASNAVQKVRVSWGPSGMAGTNTKELDCSAGQGKLGDLPAEGGSFGIVADGLDSGGVARFTHFGTTLNVGAEGTFGRPVDLTLRPKPSDVIVTWDGCPPGFVIPYFVAIYARSADGGSAGMRVQDTQVSCSARTATLENVAPGDYVVEVDSRAISPLVRGRKNVTVRGGENATVDFDL